MPSYVYFLISLIALIAGYAIYGKIIENIFKPDFNRKTPAITSADGVDFIEIKPIRAFFIQLLNIAGVGPIFGPILGALYGPYALLWVVIGCIFGGAVHDYFSGMMSIRYQGKSVGDIVGLNLGSFFKQLMRWFSIVLLLLVGVVFVAAPAGLLAKITPLSVTFWVIIIFSYYFLATILPIDKIIGKIYPFFAAILLFMAFSLIIALFVEGYNFYPSLKWVNQHPTGLPAWPLLFITIACGAISGFHATQSPMMARCLTNEKYGRPVFFGGMIAEGIIALIWVTLGMTFYQSPEALQTALANGGPSGVVTSISHALLGSNLGYILAMLGVVILPITSGDTAFRAARLALADIFKISQHPLKSRLLLAIPLFIIGIILNRVDFAVIWRYFGFANQSLACLMLWAAAAYLVNHRKFHWIATLPAIFMTAVCATFILFNKIGLNLSYNSSCIGGIIIAVIATIWFLLSKNWFLNNKQANTEN